MSRNLLGQVAAAVVMSMTPFIYGTTLSFGGLLLAESQLAEQARLSIGDAVMIAAASNFGRMAGCLLSAQLTDRLGVLRVIQLGTPLNLLAWPLMTLTAGRGTVMAGSIMAGSIVGLSGLTGRLYIAEVTTSRYRPVLCYFPGLALGLGLLLSFSLSGLMPWRYAVIMCGIVPSVVQVVGTLLLPNSPRWLMNRGYADEQVRKSIVFYRGREAEIGTEMKEIRQSLQGRHNLDIARQVHLILTNWEVGKPCLLMFIQFTFETFCGGVVLTQYAQSVFQMAVQSLSPINCTQILAGLQMAAIAFSGYLLQLFGRKTVLVGAAMLTCLAQLAVAVYFHLEDTLGSQQWLVVVGIVVANAASNGGISQLSHLYLGELLPTRVRQMVGSAVSLYMGALSIAFIYLFPVMTSALGSAGLFTVLAGVNVLQMAFAYFCMPETQGLTLEEVQVRHFSSKKSAPEPMRESEKDGAGIVVGTGGISSIAKIGLKTFNKDELKMADQIGTNNSQTKDEGESQGEVNAAFEDTEKGLRRRKTSERTDDESQNGGHNCPRNTSAPTAELQTDEETPVSQPPAEAADAAGGDKRHPSAACGVITITVPSASD